MLSLVIPTYNERENIAAVIHRIHATLTDAQEEFEIIVVDDDSPDQTWRVAEDLTTEYPTLKVMRRRNERGLATAVVTGWKASTGDILGVIDGDLQHQPEILKELLKALTATGADIAIASRHVGGGGVSDWNALRRAISWGATGLATLVLPGILRYVRDPMSGYFLLRRSVIDGVELAPRGYKILLELLAKGKYRSVKEVPYIFEERKIGSSKLGPRQYFEYLLHLGRLAAETGEAMRFAVFCLVGSSGVLVNEAVLWFVASHGYHYVQASVLAVELAIINNFLWNDLWTFRDSVGSRPDLANRLKRFFKFNAICAMGAAMNVWAVWSVTELLNIHYLISNLIGMGVGTCWNYALNVNVTWTMAIPQQNRSFEMQRNEADGGRDPQDVAVRPIGTDGADS
jgi:dolichol-phosphate mannosyltransferase